VVTHHQIHLSSFRVNHAKGKGRGVPLSKMETIQIKATTSILCMGSIFKLQMNITIRPQNHLRS